MRVSTCFAIQTIIYSTVSPRSQVHINRMSVHDEPTIPHGGVKSSGWGRFNAEWGIDEFLRLKTITFKE